MDTEIGSDAVLDYTELEVSPAQNGYEAVICSDGRIERIFSGTLDQLVLHLSAARSDGLSNNIKLELPKGIRDASWFTKSTLTRFLHLVNSPQLLKNMTVTLNEMSQLEEARQFHLNLYSQVPQNTLENGITDNSHEMEPSLKLGVQTASSDPTKNELLRAMELRLAASRKDVAAAFDRGAGATCCIEHITALDEFARHFGTTDLRKFLSKYLELASMNQAALPASEQLKYGGADLSKDMPKPEQAYASPAKIAEIERQGSTQSEDSSSSSEDDSTPRIERSRPLVRSASPRRSASPMRRVQIGRSGSHRATALTIKSLGYFPAREKLLSNRDAIGNSSEDEESEQPARKPESNVRRMSVQDAINLFESKQRDQKSDFQKLRSSAEISISSTNKSVLRRWSAGMGDSSTRCESSVPPENEASSACDNMVQDSEKNNDPEVAKLGSGLVDTAGVARSSAVEEVSINDRRASAAAKPEEIPARVTDSVEWTRQKEAELNQLLMTMMETKPSKYQNATSNENEKQELSEERRGGFYGHYREKRDEKLQGEKARKPSHKEAQFKAMHQMLDKKKVEMVSKSGGNTKKQNAPSLSRTTHSLSPSIASKKDVPSKQVGVRKTSPKPSSPLPAVRSSWPSAPSPRSIVPSPTKASGGVSSAGPPPSRRKSQGTPSPTPSTTKRDKPKREEKSSKGERTETRQRLKSQVTKTPESLIKSSKPARPKGTPTSGDDSATGSAKPSFYSKVTKKSSVVPLEAKPFLRKGTGMGPSVGIKAKVLPSDESSKSSGNLVQELSKDVAGVGITEATSQLPAEDPAATENAMINLEDSVNAEPNPLEESVNAEPNSEKKELDHCATEPVETFNRAEDVITEIPADEDSGISSSAWVEVDPPELPESHNSGRGMTEIVTPAVVGPVAISSPRVRHSLSQMLQAENSEPEIIEWGNAEIPPALVYQKESPKGLKRLLKFARKSKGEANSTGWASPSGFSEGEDDTEDLRVVGKKQAEAPLRKAALQGKGFGQQKAMLSDSYHDRTMDVAHELLSAETNGSDLPIQASHKRGHASTATSTKGSRSFFSLSTFRSSKSSDTKLR